MKEEAEEEDEPHACLICYSSKSELEAEGREHTVQELQCGHTYCEACLV